MTNELQLDFNVDPETTIERFAKIICEQYPAARVKNVEEVLAADDGPINQLGWIALDGHQDHHFFYQDENPDQDALRWLLSLSPKKSDMPQLKRVLQQSYDSYAEGNQGILVEIPDPYLPGSKARASIGFYHNPLTNEINSGVSGTPLNQQEKILEDVAKELPARDIETFVLNAVRSLREELHNDANRHVVEGKIRKYLETDEHFRKETTREIPEGIHPGYTGKEAELWQKPASHVDYLSGSAGFVQVWTTKSESDIALVSVTRGEFDPESAIDKVKKSLSEKTQ